LRSQNIFLNLAVAVFGSSSLKGRRKKLERSARLCRIAPR
jgi:hypothetical protein